MFQRGGGFSRHALSFLLKEFIGSILLRSVLLFPTSGHISGLVNLRKGSTSYSFAFATLQPR